MSVGHTVRYHDGGPLSAIGLLVIFIKSSSSYTVCYLTGEVGSYNTLSMLMKYCTNVAHCVNSCHGGFSLTGSETGRCPACTCTSVLRVFFLISHCVFSSCSLYYFNNSWRLVSTLVDKVPVNLHNETLKQIVYYFLDYIHLFQEHRNQRDSKYRIYCRSLVRQVMLKPYLTCISRMLCCYILYYIRL